MQKRAGFYERRIFPWLNDRLTACADFLRLREQALGVARGRVMEIGFGSGANLAYYPEGVDSVVAVEPNEGMRRRAAALLPSARFSVDLLACEAERLPLEDRSFDTAVSILTLCSVSDPARAIGELHRVLRDEGRLIVVEHGLAEDAGVARWQNWLNPIQKVLGCGCHLNRPIKDLIGRGGFELETLRSFYSPGAPRTHGWITMGSARKSCSQSAQDPAEDARRTS